jgi:hypothetical protein
MDNPNALDAIAAAMSGRHASPSVTEQFRNR